MEQIMLKKSLAAVAVAAALMFTPTAANALDCTNASRPAYTGSDYTFVPGPNINVHVAGNWAYVLEAGAWVFLPPGTVPEAPGHNGQFQSGEGFALLVNAQCDSNGAVLDNRQSDHGIQLMHDCLTGP
jgi:hypothetical protein